jgi:two-component system probable response regulator PhcQ
LSNPARQNRTQGHAEVNEMPGVVLIVDDDSHLLDSMRRALRREPYIVLTSQSGEEALGILDSTPVDVIISDQDMPGMSGQVFLKRVRELHPDITRLMLTGKATLEGAIDAINNGGISRLLQKPCDPIDLIMSIRQGLQHHKLMIAAHQLLQRNARQSKLLDRLERLYPNITKVERDSDGAINIKDLDGSPDQLLEEINAYLERE